MWPKRSSIRITPHRESVILRLAERAEGSRTGNRISRHLVRKATAGLGDPSPSARLRMTTRERKLTNENLSATCVILEMALRIVRLGTPRKRGEGLRIGTVRRPPRGVRKKDYAALDYFDLWLPELAPSAPLVKWALSVSWTVGRWATYRRRYLQEMKQPPAQRLLALLAALSRQSNFSVGCYCEDANRCHRTLLGQLLREEGARIV